MKSKFVDKLNINDTQVNIYSLKAIEKTLPFCKFFPFSYRVLLENILRNSKSDVYIMEKAKLLNKVLKALKVLEKLIFFLLEY